MFYLLESDKSFAEVIFDLEPVVQRLGFAILHAHDFSDMLRRRDIEFDEECQVFDIVNARHLEKLLTHDLSLSAVLPWRISVYTETGATKIALLRPNAMLAALSGSEVLARLASEIDERMIQIVDEVR